MWGLLELLFEKQGEVGDAFKAYDLRNGRHKKVGSPKQGTRALKPDGGQVRLGRHARPLMKFPPDLRRAYAGIFNQLL